MEIISVDSNLPANMLRIELFLGNVCNYKCWYCFPGSNEGNNPWPTDLQILSNNLKVLIDYYKEKKNKNIIYIHIIGGEPTLWKDFGKFIQCLKESNDCVISISTNASRTIRWWEKYGEYVDHVMISCHWEKVDTNHIISVADLLYKKNVTVHAMVLMDPKKWDKCVSIIDELKLSKNKWSITAKEIHHSTVSYTEDQKKFISKAVKRKPNFFYWFMNNKINRKKSTVTFSNNSRKKVDSNWISLNDLNHFYGWDCNLGVDTMFINTIGEISGTCNENLYNLDFKYNIFDKDFKDKFNPTIVSIKCTKETCSCQAEINCTKKKII
jgi:organic radical activating enzyme